jgi:hypothetical protein
VARVKRVANETGEQLGHLVDLRRDQLTQGVEKGKELITEGRDFVSTQISRVTS